MTQIRPEYYQGTVECIEAIETATDGLTGFQGFCVGQVIKYLWRYKNKGGIADVIKAGFYLDRLYKRLEQEQATVAKNATVKGGKK